MDGNILEQEIDERPSLALYNYVMPYDHYTIACRARKDGGSEGFIIVFNDTESNNYCQVNFGSKSGT